MICPSKLCKAEIPDDSCYCDQCGIKVLKCIKCGAIGISKFCGKCGGIMTFPGESKPDSLGLVSSVALDAPAPTNSVSVVSSQLVQQSLAQPIQFVAGGTKVVQLESPEKQLQLCNSNGIILNVIDGSLLGRTTGDFVQQLGTISVISSRHARISKKDGNWFITDLHSTNKTYVNSVQLTPDVPAEIKENDVIILANVSFVARFK